MEPQQRRRKRGVILSSQGWKKLQDAIYEAESQENYGERYTLEALSERTGLDVSTVARVLEREAGVEKRSSVRFFRAFNLELKPISH
jgi:AraC-like DNA-binding protein